MITEGASSIYDMSYGGHGSAGDYFSVDVHEESRREDDKLAIQMIRRMEFGRLLSYGVSVVEIYLFLANSFRGLLFINFSLRDIKKLEETEQVQTLVDLYDIGCDDLRAVLGGQMSIQNLISFGWKAKTFRTLGIDMHQLCILKLQKDNIPTFGFTIDEWLNELRMTKTVVKILRIHANDFQKPGGKLAGVGWDLARIIHQLKITVEEVVDFRLNGYSSCLGRKVSDDRGFTDRTPKKILKKLSSSGTHSTEEDQQVIITITIATEEERRLRITIQNTPLLTIVLHLGETEGNKPFTSLFYVSHSMVPLPHHSERMKISRWGSHDGDGKIFISARKKILGDGKNFSAG
jgi:hypothetical protein